MGCLVLSLFSFFSQLRLYSLPPKSYHVELNVSFQLPKRKFLCRQVHQLSHLDNVLIITGVVTTVAHVICQ